jgi:hypothetical protein
MNFSVTNKWTEVSDFGNIDNLYAVMNFATGERMEQFDVRGDELVKLYTMVYRVDDRWFNTAFRATTLLYSLVFEIQTVEIICGKWTQTSDSEAIHCRIVEKIKMQEVEKIIQEFKKNKNARIRNKNG